MSLFSIHRGDCLEWFRAMPADSVDLVLGSPPYEAARTYGIGFKLRGQDWVDWMVEVFREASRVCTGAIVMVLEGQTRQYKWSATPALLMADLHRAGFNLRKPPAYCRVGIPGSGGPDWFRNDYEFCVCVTRPGKLLWSDKTACGHPPKWAPGGAMSHRLSNGSRVNQWGKTGTEQVNGSCNRLANGKKQKAGRPSHVMITKAEKLALGAKSHTKNDGENMREQTYLPPVLANPGNLIKCKVGGGLMGHPLTALNEAPYPLKLADFFVRSLCPPGGIVADPFSGSATTGHAAIESGRRYLGCDVRQSQVELGLRRLAGITPTMFAEVPA